MKNILLTSMLLVTGICCCKEDVPKIYNEGILGKWELMEYYVNPGVGPSDWQTPDDDFKHTVEFKSNGDFISSGTLYYGATAYQIPDTSTIKFLHATQISGDLHYQYSLQENNSILIISPLCFEGCSYKYSAIK